MMLSLMDAINSDCLEEFIAHEETCGVGQISAAEFDKTATVVIKTQQSDDQTSGLPASGDLPEK